MAPDPMTENYCSYCGEIGWHLDACHRAHDVDLNPDVAEVMAYNEDAANGPWEDA